MSEVRVTQPAIEGWFEVGELPSLVGTRCPSCQTIAFPPTVRFCPNPQCSSDELQPHRLSTRGRVWSVTTNHYAPPAPYIRRDPFLPYTLVAVELELEKMVVLGPLDPEGPPAEFGAEVDLTIGVLYSDEACDYLMWQWRVAATTETSDV